MSLGGYDPDGEAFGAAKHPAWSIPKSDLAKRALAACGRKYFHGHTKHDSEFERFDAHEQRALGANDDSYLYRKWIENGIQWAETTNVKGIEIAFPTVLLFLDNNERRIDWIARNKKRLLEERKNSVPTIGVSKVSDDWYTRQLDND
jgi:hypothetical protein